MKLPEKIYIKPGNKTKHEYTTEREDKEDIEYIRAGVVFELLKTAEDHAYFAGYDRACERAETKAEALSQPFSAKWLVDSVDTKGLKSDEYSNVDMFITDVISDERGEAGCVDISYCGQLFCTVSKGLQSDGWLVSISEEPRDDTWAAKVHTIADFLRLFRVITGLDLPLKKACRAKYLGENFANTK